MKILENDTSIAEKYFFAKLTPLHPPETVRNIQKLKENVILAHYLLLFQLFRS